MPIVGGSSMRTVTPPPSNAASEALKAKVPAEASWGDRASAGRKEGRNTHRMRSQRRRLPADCRASATREVYPGADGVNKEGGVASAHLRTYLSFRAHVGVVASVRWANGGRRPVSCAHATAKKTAGRRRWRNR